MLDTKAGSTQGGRPSSRRLTKKRMNRLRQRGLAMPWEPGTCEYDIRDRYIHRVPPTEIADDDDDAHVDRVNRFKSVLRSAEEGEQIVRQHLLHGSAVAVTDAQQYAIKQRVSTEFSVDANQDVFVVGSAKLGFSVAPTKRYRPFGDESDIDVAIVSHSLYERVWHEVHRYSLSGADWPKKERFERYLAWGWIRPDLLPRSREFSLSNSWFEFFRGLHSERIAGPYKIAAALYHDISFLIKYQDGAVTKCREEVS